MTERSQLRMGLTRLDDLTAPQPPPAYSLCGFLHGDEDAWIALLNTGGFGVWDRARLDRMLAGERAPLPRETITFAVRGEEIVGAACAFLHPGTGGAVAELGWVVVHPDHRGRGLGAAVCRAVLRYLQARGYGYAYLLTEGDRLPAIATYLRLGFEPELLDASHPARWAALGRVLHPRPGPAPPR